MEILYLLIPLSVVLVFVIGVMFRWFVKNGQFDDLEGPAYRLLMDNDKPPERKESDGKRAVADGRPVSFPAAEPGKRQDQA